MVSMVGMKRTLQFIAIFIVLITSFQNCGYVGSSDPEAYMLASEFVTFDEVSAKVFVPYCIQCHKQPAPDAGLDLSTYSSTMLAVVPYDIVGSHLMHPLETGEMPPAGALSQTEVNLVANWILSGAPETASTSPSPTPVPTATPVPTPTPTPNPSATPLPATFTYINNNILQTKCLLCHNTNKMDGGFSYSAYADTIKSLVMGNAATSKLYIQVNTNAMPKGGPPLTAAEKTAIQTWINNGAANN
jgi:uncharacterized membrane protein